MFECSGLRGALLRTGRRERVPSSGQFRSHRHRKTRGDRCRVSRRQDSSRRDAVHAPFVQAEQDGSIRIHDLTKVVMARSRLGLTE